MVILPNPTLGGQWHYTTTQKSSSHERDNIPSFHSKQKIIWTSKESSNAFLPRFIRDSVGSAIRLHFIRGIKHKVKVAE